MHELDDKTTFDRVVNSLEKQLGVDGIIKIASGNEFFIFKAELSTGPVVIKVPKDKIFSNVNDAHIDSRVLLDQEYNLTRHVHNQGIDQIAMPEKQLEVAGFGALVVDYIPSDNSKPNQYELGQLLARIHCIEIPTFELSAQENSEVPELVTDRLNRRWNELHNLVDKLPDLPADIQIMNVLEETRPVKQFLHMDFREANFRTDKGRVLAVIDWSNSLIGHPALELARAAETGETGEEFLKGYASVKPLPVVSPPIEIIFRLDTATMLALVFLSEDPDPELGPVFVARVRELHESLLKELAK